MRDTPTDEGYSRKTPRINCFSPSLPKSPGVKQHRPLLSWNKEKGVKLLTLYGRQVNFPY